VSDHDYLRRTEDAQRALRGEGPPPLLLDSRLGAALDLVSGRVSCTRCGLDTLELVQVIAEPAPLYPEMIISAMRCRTCEAEQAVTLEARDGAVTLGTSRPR
jgi:hypothetical protein